MDVSVTMQLKFQRTFSVQERGGASDSVHRSTLVVCSCFQLCYRDEYAQCKLCNYRRFHSAVLVDVLLVMQRLVPMVQTEQFSGWFFSRVDFLGALDDSQL